MCVYIIGGLKPLSHLQVQIFAMFPLIYIHIFNTLFFCEYGIIFSKLIKSNHYNLKNKKCLSLKFT